MKPSDVEDKKKHEDVEDGSSSQPTIKQVSYLEKIVKYVPAPIIAAYVAAAGVIQEDPNNPIWLIWAVFLSLQILTPLYIYYIPGEHNSTEHSIRFHVLAGTLSFFVWVFALGEPWSVTFEWYRPVFGSLVLIITTLLLPILEKMLVRTEFFKPEGSK